MATFDTSSLPRMSRLGFGLSATTVCLAVFLARAVYRYYRWPSRTMRGPKFQGIVFGSADPKQLDWATLAMHEEWVQEYGPTMRLWGLFGTKMILTADVTALRHVLANGTIYEKTEEIRHELGEIAGRGLLFAEGSDHKRQRRVMNPAFGPLQVRRFTELFISKANELKDVWTDLCAQTSRKDGFQRVDAFAWLNKVTLDIIGLAGFNYDIDALHAPADNPNPLNEAVRTMFSFDLNVMAVIQLLVPAFRRLPTARVREITKANRVIHDIGMRLIAEKKAAIAQSGVETVERKDIEGHDLLSLLIRSNMASDLPQNARLSDKEMLAQVPTFLVAGHETTSTALAWALYCMSCEREVQTKLRAELRQFPNETPTDAELNGLTYLDYVVREVLRLYAPVYSTERIASQDDVVPLQVPYTDVNGVVHHEIRLRKGDAIAIPIQLLNSSTLFWGEDAHEFRPERWENLPETVKEIPGVLTGLATFLSGVHACIGYRFSIVEMKALLFMIVRNFEFQLAVTPLDVIRKTMIVGRPFLMGNPGAGAQLPLLIRPVKK